MLLFSNTKISKSLQTNNMQRVEDLQLIQRCSAGNTAYFYIFDDDDFHQTDIFKCMDKLCICRQQQLLARRQFDEYQILRPFSDFVRMMNHRIRNLEVEKCNKQYQKKIDMYNRLIQQIEIERDELSQKIKERNLSLYMSAEEFSAYQKLKKPSCNIRSSELQNASLFFDLTNKKRLNNLQASVENQIYQVETKIRKILEDDKEKSDVFGKITKRRYSRSRGTTRRKRHQKSVFEQRRRKLKEQTQHIRLQQQYSIKEMQINNQRKDPIPNQFDVKEITALQIKQKKNDDKQPLNFNFAKIRQLSVQFQDITHFVFDSIHNMKRLQVLKLSALESEDREQLNNITLLTKIAYQVPDLKGLCLRNFTAGFDSVKLLAKLENLRELDLSYNLISIQTVMALCKYWKSLSSLKINNIHENYFAVKGRMRKLRHQEFQPLNDMKNQPYLEEQNDSVMNRFCNEFIKTPQRGRRNSSSSHDQRRRRSRERRENSFGMRRRQSSQSSDQQRTPIKQTFQFKLKIDDILNCFTNISSLSVLHIACNELQISHIEKICKHSPDLKELNVSNNQIGDEGVVFISEHLLKLEKLMISTCGVTSHGFVFISHAPFKLKLLSARNNEASPNAISVLFENQAELQKLDLREVFVPTISRDHRCQTSKGFTKVADRLLNLKQLLISRFSGGAIYYVSKVKSLELLTKNDNQDMCVEDLMKLRRNLKIPLVTYYGEEIFENESSARRYPRMYHRNTKITRNIWLLEQKYDK